MVYKQVNASSTKWRERESEREERERGRVLERESKRGKERERSAANGRLEWLRFGGYGNILRRRKGSFSVTFSVTDTLAFS